MANKVKPIGPGEVEKLRGSNIPDAVFEVFNELIARKFLGGSATVKQEDVVSLLVNKGFDRNEMFEKGWLDVEGIYRKAGWKVEYDKPGYNETYDAFFVFWRKSDRD